MSASDLRIKRETHSDLQKSQRDLPPCNQTDSTERIILPRNTPNYNNFGLDSPENFSARLENISISQERTSQINPEENPKEALRQQYFRDSHKTYHPIKRNVFLDRKKRIPAEEDIFVCDCIKADSRLIAYLEMQNPHISYNCGDKCINRYMCTECEEESCPCEDECQNRRFQLVQGAKTYPKPTEGKGWGLFAGENIKKGDFVLQYVGEVFNVNSDEGQLRVATYNRSTCTYLMKISQNEVIDPTFRGNQARFINHSCDPNCITQKWNVMGEICVGVFAIKDIKEDKELSFDYQFDIFKTSFTKCLCGAPNCKGYLGRKPQDYSLEEWEERLENLPCSICEQNVEDDDDKLLLCDHCHEGFHIFCLDPPLTSIPEGDWFCDGCTIKLEQEKNLKRDFNPLEMNTKLYEMVKNERSKLHAFRTTKKPMASSEDEDMHEESDGTEMPESHEIHEKKRRAPRFAEDEDETGLARKRSEHDTYDDLYPRSEGEDSDVRIKKKVKVKAEAKPVEEITMVKEEEQAKFKSEEEKLERKETIKTDEERKDRKRPRAVRTQTTLINEFKEKALGIFNEKVKEGVFWQRIQEIEKKNMRGTWNIHAGDEALHKRSKMVNTIQLEVIKKNQSIFRRIGTRLFWEHHHIKKINIFNKHVEVTVMGYKEQLEAAELIFQILDDIAEEIERMRGQREALLRLPAMYLRKITGSYHNQQITDLENRFEISIQYSKEFLNDGCYPITAMTDLKIKGVEENLIAAHQHINYQIKKFKTKRLFCNRRDYTTLLRSLNNLKRRIYPAELRFNKTKEGALKELNHPFYYIQYKEKEVALIGTEREIQEAERILEETFREAHSGSGSDEHEFGCVHYLWPTTNANPSTLQRFKSDIEKEVPGTRFVYFEPIVPRKNITLSIFGSFKEIARAKELLKERVESLRSTTLTLEAFQEHVKYQIVKYLFKCLDNFYITGNIADIKFWDLQSVEFEKIHRMTPLRQHTLQNIFAKDTTLQLYVLHICDFSDSRVWDYFNLSSKSVLDLLKRLLQSSMNANSSLIANLQCERIFKKSQNLSHYESRRHYKHGDRSGHDRHWSKKSDAGGQEGQRSGRSSRGVSREGSVSLGSARSVDTSSEKQEDIKMPIQNEPSVEIKKEEKMDSEPRHENRYDDRHDKARRQEEGASYQERSHYHDSRSYRRGEEERYNDKYRDKHRHDYKGRESGYHDYKKYNDKGERSRSRSESRLRRMKERRSPSLGSSKDERREHNIENKDRYRDSDRNSNYHKKFDDRGEIKEPSYYRRDSSRQHPHKRTSKSRSRSQSRSYGENRSQNRTNYGGYKRYDYHSKDRERDHDRDRKYHDQGHHRRNQDYDYDKRRENEGYRPHYRHDRRASPHRRNIEDRIERSPARREEPNQRRYESNRDNKQPSPEVGISEKSRTAPRVSGENEGTRQPVREQKESYYNQANIRREEERSIERGLRDKSERSYKRTDYGNEEHKKDRNRFESSSTGMSRNKYHDKNETWSDRRKPSRFSSYQQNPDENKDIRGSRERGGRF